LHVHGAAGDKVETAISIAYSCRLFTEDMGILEMREEEFRLATDDDTVLEVGVRVWLSHCRRLLALRSLWGGLGPVLMTDATRIMKRCLRVFREALQDGPGASPTAVADSMVHCRALPLRLQVLNTKRTAVEQLNRQMHALAGHTNVGIVIEGGALNMALAPGAQDALMALCRDCKSVVCCRVTPMQKAQVCVCGQSVGLQAAR
jgi:magnesium-transporting ATPase (P-type)